MSRVVLLIDPDVDALGAMASALRARGLTVDLADDAARALERARRSHPEAVLVADALTQTTSILAELRADKELAGAAQFVLVDEDDLTKLPSDHLPRKSPDVVARRLYALPSKTAVAVADRGDFRGDLQQVSVLDLLQLVSMNRRTGVLSVSTPLGAGEVRLNEGEIVDAVYRRLEGEKALYRLLAEHEGTFAFAGGAPSPHRRVQMPTHVLLMEGVRQIDEVRRLRSELGVEDALVWVAPSALQSATSERVGEALRTPRTVSELLDELPMPDIELLEVVKQMLSESSVRQIQRGTLRVELADPEQLAVLGALLKRLAGKGFMGSPRLVMAGNGPQLATIMHSLGRVADATLPAQNLPALGVPYVMASIRLGEGGELDVVGLPLEPALAPLWSLALPGAAVAVVLDSDQQLAAAAVPRALEDACSLAGVRLLYAGELMGDVDESDPAHAAALIRLALESASGR
jgi:DNA-binding transcriptional ArsR family regulator